MMETKMLLTVEEMARALDVSRPMAYQLVHTDGFPTIHIGRAIRIPRDGLAAWIEEHSGEQVL